MFSIGRNPCSPSTGIGVQHGPDYAYRAHEDIERRLPVLSTFLGHAHVADTYWYLSMHPELMHLATSRLERRWGLTHED